MNSLSIHKNHSSHSNEYSNIIIFKNNNEKHEFPNTNIRSIHWLKVFSIYHANHVFILTRLYILFSFDNDKLLPQYNIYTLYDVFHKKSDYFKQTTCSCLVHIFLIHKIHVCLICFKKVLNVIQNVPLFFEIYVYSNGTYLPRLVCCVNPTIYLQREAFPLVWVLKINKIAINNINQSQNHNVTKYVYNLKVFFFFAMFYIWFHI